MVHGFRRQHPRIGGKKLYFLLKDDMAQAGIRLGRDHEWSEDFSSDFFVFRGFTYLYKYLIFNYLSCFYLIDLLY